MRALLLASVCVIGFGGTAMAMNGEPPTVMDHYAAALGVNLGTVSGNSSGTGWGQANGVEMRGSFGGARGVFNVNQNAGAGAAQQNAVAVAYVQGCDCEVTFRRGDGDANAVAGNSGTVSGNSSENGNRFSIFGPGTSADATLDDSFGGANGVVQVNQNAGANSLQQNATAVAYADNITGTRGQDRDAWAIAGNEGVVSGSGNVSNDTNHTATGTISGSFSGFTGVAGVNQNLGANSLQQNSAALSAVEFCDCTANDLSTTIAAAANIGSAIGGNATAIGGGAGVSMTGSFNGMTGIVQVNQNAGANSLAQNAVSVGAVYNR